MVRRPSTTARIALVSVKVAAVTGITLMACGVGASVQAPDVAARPEGAQVDARQAQVDKLMSRNDCSVEGFGPDVIPGSAIVVRDEHVQQVSFDDGWAIYTGDAPGVLVALCKVNV